MSAGVTSESESCQRFVSGDGSVLSFAVSVGRRRGVKTLRKFVAYRAESGTLSGQPAGRRRYFSAAREALYIAFNNGWLVLAAVILREFRGTLPTGQAAC